MEVVSGDSWSYKTCKAPVKLSPPTTLRPAFTGRMPSLSRLLTYLFVCKYRWTQAVISGCSTPCCRSTLCQLCVSDTTSTDLSGSRKSPPATILGQSAGSTSAPSTHSAMSRLRSSSGSTASRRRTFPSLWLPTALDTCTFTIGRSRSRRLFTTARPDRK